MTGATDGTAAAGPRWAAEAVLGATLAVAAFATLMAAVLLVVHPQLGDLLTRETVQQDQGAKTLLYLTGFGVITPLAAVAGVRLAPRVPDPYALAGLLAVVLVLAHLSGGGLGTLLIAMVLWTAGALVIVSRNVRVRPWLALLAGLGAVLCFTHLSAGRLAVLAVALVVLAAAGRAKLDLPRPPRPWGLVADGLVLALIALAVPNLVVFTTSGALPNVFTSPGIIQFHHDFLLGPTNQVLGGGTLLVDSPVSQYGVGTVYFLAAWFDVAPIGYGTYGLLDGILTAGYFAAGFGVLRLAHTPRLLAAAAMAVAVIAFVLALEFPVGALPQQGPLRFGLPMVLIAATVAGLRWRSRAWDAVAIVAVGVSSIWSIEAFAFTGLTLLALLAAQTALRPPHERRRWLARRIAIAAVACVGAHVVLALATLIRTGSLPDWGQYLAYLRAFLGGGEAGTLTYGFDRWSPGLPLAALYAVSAIGLGVLLRRPAEITGRDRIVLVAQAGLTAYGIALFSYVQNRSSTYLLSYVALPALLSAVLWAARGPRRSALAVVSSLGLVLLVSAFPVGERLGDSALGHVRPGGGLRSALTRLWHPPPIDPRATEAERLLDQYTPGAGPVLVLLPRSPELAVETLLRSGRVNRLPVGNPVEESFVPSVWAPPLRRAIARLGPGDRVLVDDATLAALVQLRARPRFDPLADPQIGADAIDMWILREIGRRFDLREVGRGTSGLAVTALTPR